MLNTADTPYHRQRAFLTAALLAVIVFSFCSKLDTLNRQSAGTRGRAAAQDQNAQTGEYFAWEKTFEVPAKPRYKQVKKNYTMDKEICRNVIQVLADAARSSQEATYSEFECWPASMNPNEYYQKYSIQSDEPSDVVFPTK